MVIEGGIGTLQGSRQLNASQEVNGGDKLWNPSQIDTGRQISKSRAVRSGKNRNADAARGQ
jgi:hypothetical protein